MNKQDIKNLAANSTHFDWQEDEDKFVRFAAECFQDFTPQWVSVEDRLPEDDQRVVIFLEGGAIASDLDIRIGMYSTQYGFGHNRVTHWQPLPAAPEVL